MKGKKIFRRIIVSVLILALALSNVSVAADQQNGFGAAEQGIEQQSGEAQDADNEGSEENGSDIATVSDSQENAVSGPSSSEGAGTGETGTGTGETGTGSGTVQTPPGAESGSGTDSVSEANQTPPGAESGNGADAVGGNNQTPPGAGSGNGADAVGGNNQTPPGTEPGNGTDAVSGADQTPPGTESGNGADAASGTGQTPPGTESGDGTDAADGTDTGVQNDGLTNDGTQGDPALEDTLQDGTSLDGTGTDGLPDDDSEEEELDLTGMYTLEELLELSDEEADYTIWMDEDGEEAAPALFSAMFAAEGRDEDQKHWGFDLYYVNQDDPYEVRQEKNFNLKYQMQFSTSQTLAKGAVQIKIESELLKDRDNHPVTPEDIGLPYGTPEEPSTSSRILFNYYTKTEENKEYLIFFNSRSIPAGTNTAWQVLYKNLRLMDLIDESEWTLTPQVFVDEEAGTIPEGEENPIEAKTYEQVMKEGKFDSSHWMPLTGSINSSVSLTSVVKTPYTQSGVNYTPGLYTVAQLNRYIKGELPKESEYRDGDNPTRLNTSEYRFVVWDVKIKGQATQPWDLYIQDHPFQTTRGTGGGMEMLSDDPDLNMDGGADPSQPRVVGYLNNTDSAAGYGLPIAEPDEKGKSSVDQRAESWGSRFYVVTAYPKVDGEFIDAPLENEITVTLKPRDGKDPVESKTSSAANWTYKEYDWAYKGDVLGISKSTDKTRYTGWLDAYRNASNLGEDYGELPFTTVGTMNGYTYTHDTSGDRVGEYKDQSYYTLTTMDDFLYAHWTDQNGQRIASRLMDGKDYYFSEITIRQEDKGYDIWEDRTDVSELAKFNAENNNLNRLPASFVNGGSVGSQVRIWAKFAEGTPGAVTKTSEDGVWELVDTVYMDASGKVEYPFDQNLIQTRKPYRVMVEHDSIDYTTSCTIDVKVRMRAASQVMSEIVDLRGDAKRDKKSPVVTFENLSGSLGTYEENGVKGYVHQGNIADKGDNAFNYETYDKLTAGNVPPADNTTLTAATQRENYGEDPKDNSQLLPIRDNASRETTWLTQTAAATKTGTSRNDVNNGRVVVDYVLTAYDGYEIYDKSCLDELSAKDKTLLSPHRTDVVFYDLLPYGVSFDGSRPVQAGVIRNLDSGGSYQKNPDLWDASQVEVSAEIVDANHNGTGRILVAFRLKFTGADAASYTAGKWIEGWGVSFRAWYDWKDGGAVNDEAQINANLCAFMPDFSERSGGSNNSHPELLGLSGQVFSDEGGAPSGYEDLVGEGNIDKINTIKVKKPDGSEVEEDVDKRPHILYADYALHDDVAVSSDGRIETLVRADADRLGTFGESTVIPMKEGNDKDGYYTYRITVSATGAMSGIVLYDHLENAAVDLAPTKTNQPFVFNDNPWHGTFQSLDLEGLKLMGVTPTVYYSTKKNATIPKGIAEPSTIFNAAGSDWIKVDDPAHFPKDADVQSLAVDLGDFTLQPNQSVSIQIRMKAPEVKAQDNYGYYTYNHASYSFVQNDVRNCLDSRSVRAARSMPETLEITKQLGEDTPSSRQDTSFEFSVYEEYEYLEEGETKPVMKKQPLAYAEYELRTADGSAGSSQITSTDGSGRLYLHAGETAVFHVADAKRLTVEETPGVFWKTEVTADQRYKEVNGVRVPNANGEIRTVIVTNTYRPVLYVEKRLSGIPASGTKNPRGEYTFDFRLTTKGVSGEYDVPAAGVEYWLVDAARLDGGMPAKLGEGETGADGGFTLKEGQIIALFPGAQGTEYQLTETDPGDDWICRQPSQTVRLEGIGDSRTFTNYYKWKDLYLTKEITGQTKADYDAMTEYDYKKGENDTAVRVYPKQFTFQVLQEADPAAGTGDVPSVKTKAHQETVRNQYALSGEGETDGESLPTVRQKAVKTADAKEPAKNDERTLVPVQGLKWVMLDADGNPADGAQPRPVENDGTFTCELGFGTVRISGLEADQNYVIREVTAKIAKDPATHDPLYVPDGDAEVKMPVYGTGSEAKIVNEYQRSTLLVTKTVAGAAQPEDGGTGDGSDNNKKEFTFLLLIENKESKNYKEAENYPYTVISPDGSSRSEVRYTGPASGADQTAAGTFTLSAGETAEFKDAGMRGQKFKVYEKTEVAPYQQIYPSANDGSADRAGYGVPSAGTFDKATEEASFVNGTSGYLYISKEYTAVGEKSEAYLAEIKSQVAKGEWFESSRNDLMSPEEWGLYATNLSGGRSNPILGYVKMTLERTDDKGNSYIWPEENTKVKMINYLKPSDQMEQVITWKAYSSIRVYPWTVIMIPKEAIGGGSYVLREQEEDQHRIINEYSEITVGGLNKAPISLVSTPLQISQSYPANDGALIGTVAEKPNATIYNKIEDTNGEGEKSCLISKRMFGESEPVPEGAELVWRVEQYVPGEQKGDGSNAPGEWIPAEGISYIIYQKADEVESVRTDSDRVCVTGADGEILIRKRYESINGSLVDTFMPQVCFPRNKVYLNLYKQDDIDELKADNVPLLRVVEVPEKSDSAWGRLMGYSFNGSYTARMLVSRIFGLDADPEEINGFANSNRMTTIRVQKSMPEGMNAPDEPFTMILKQVLSASGVPEESEALSSGMTEIVHAEPAENVTYTLHDAEGKETRGAAGPGGVIRLRAGEYADVDVPEGTLWTLEEDQNASPNYRLASLTPDPGSIDAAKLGDNQMLVRASRERETYTVEWWLCTDDEEDKHNSELKSRETRTGFVGDWVWTRDVWMTLGDEMSRYVSCNDENHTDTLYINLTGSGDAVLRVYLRERPYTLTYDLNGETVNTSLIGPFLFYTGTGTKMMSGSGPYSGSVSVSAAEAGVRLGSWKTGTKVGFQGWSTNPNATTAEYKLVSGGIDVDGDGVFNAETDKLSFTDGTRLYAVWQKWTVSLSSTIDNVSFHSPRKVPYSDAEIPVKWILPQPTGSTINTYKCAYMWVKDAIPAIPEAPDASVSHFRTYEDDPVFISGDTTFYVLMLDPAKTRYVTYSLYKPAGSSKQLVERVTYLYPANSNTEGEVELPILQLDEIKFSTQACNVIKEYTAPATYKDYNTSYTPGTKPLVKISGLKLDIILSN